jgi:hypothetical protein
MIITTKFAIDTAIGVVVSMRGPKVNKTHISYFALGGFPFGEEQIEKKSN